MELDTVPCFVDLKLTDEDRTGVRFDIFVKGGPGGK
jgi:stage V sporulation protein SpoVS